MSARLVQPLQLWRWSGELAAGQPRSAFLAFVLMCGRFHNASPSCCGNQTLDFHRIRDSVGPVKTPIRWKSGRSKLLSGKTCLPDSEKQEFNAEACLRKTRGATFAACRRWFPCCLGPIYTWRGRFCLNPPTPRHHLLSVGSNNSDHVQNNHRSRVGISS